ncbi:hypothetical protein AAEO50_00820 [Rossellomorea oryzaecorticis]|uniref:Lipoprotein n=2 Tax=Rossellomorea oryzaecorticis TaxID=1396505 RepID=A0ABU9K3Z6_9BACI
MILIGLAVLLSGCFSDGQKVSSNSINYLNGEDTVSLFDFDKSKVTDQLKLKISSEFPFGRTSINPVEKTTLTMILNSETNGYHYYLQSSESFKEIGKVDESIYGGVYTNGHIYTIVYDKEGTILKKFDPETFKEKSKWTLKGDPEAIVADYNTGTVYALTRTDDILLYTVKDQEITEKKLLDNSYEINAQFEDKTLIVSISQLVRQNGKETNNKEEKRIVFYDTDREKITNTYTTEHPPKFVMPSENGLLVFSGTPNNNYLEEINDENEIISSSELETTEIFGLAVHQEHKYMVARDGIYEVKNGQVSLIEKNEVPDSVDLSIQ